MGEDKWIDGAMVLKLLKSNTAYEVAAADLKNAIRLGEVHVRFASRTVTRTDGSTQLLKGENFTPRLWGRAQAEYERATHKKEDLWNAKAMKLPASGKDQAVDLTAVEFDQREVRAVLTRHGMPELPPPPPPTEPRPRSGGHHMGAHGAVISSVTIELLGMRLIDVKKVTEKDLAETLAGKFSDFASKREKIGLENRLRMARKILVNVIAELERLEGQGGSVR